VCREPPEYFVCHNGTDKTVTPDFMYVDRQVGWAERLNAGDGVVVGQRGSSPAAKIHDAAFGYMGPHTTGCARWTATSTRCSGFG